MPGWGVGRGGIILNPDVAGVRNPGHLSRPVHRQHTKRKGLALLGVRDLSVVVFELGIRNSELSKKPGEAPEMFPTASRGNLLANQSCRNSLRPVYLSWLPGNTQQVWPPGARLDSAAPQARLESNLSLGRQARAPGCLRALSSGEDPRLGDGKEQVLVFGDKSLN